MATSTGTTRKQYNRDQKIQNNNNSNPLAQARRRGGPSRGKKSTASNASLATAADDVWFRKSGTGAACFVAYYSSQELNLARMVVDKVDNNGNGDDVGDKSISYVDQTKAVTTGIPPQTVPKRPASGPGLSRAAQRRKRRKGATSTVLDEPVSIISENKKDIEDPLLPPSTSISYTSTAMENDTTDDNNKNLLLIKAVSNAATIATAACGTQSARSCKRDGLEFFEALARPHPLTFRIRHTANTDAASAFQADLDRFNDTTNDDNAAANGLQKHSATTTAPMLRRRIQIVPVAKLNGNKLEDNVATNHRSLVFQAACSKVTLPNSIKTLLLDASQNGTIARQELGSMLPVALLTLVGAWTRRAKNHGPITALDMCAAPGSKTLQALEILLSTTASLPPETATTTRSQDSMKHHFMLVANDVLQSRLETLQQAVQRSGMPRTNAITYTCQDASKFALRVAISVTPKTKDTPIVALTKTARNGSSTQSLLFDVIMCDVPCSGDGTIRKDRHILTRWTPAVGNQLHTTQISLLTRAIQLLKPGGTVCYSTCSFNPVENEAVVAAVLQHFNSGRNLSGQKDVEAALPVIELVECPSIPGITLRNGISDWEVAEYNASYSEDDVDDEDGRLSATGEAMEFATSSHQPLVWYKTFADAAEITAEKGSWAKKTMWPPSNVDILQLSRCKRLWPQDQDSGGFFVALIRKCD